MKKRLPKSMTVHKLKIMIQRLWKVEPEQQKLFFVDSSENAVPNEMDDDYKELEFYGVEEGGTISMELVDLEQEKNLEQQKRQQYVEKMKQQEKDADTQVKWKKLM